MDIRGLNEISMLYRGKRGEEFSQVIHAKENFSEREKSKDGQHKDKQ